jgi:predicted house-cleaning noncanonical NTP pyrophosphatase (MazG superfamily)
MNGGNCMNSDEKLVRDRIPELIENNGQKPKYRRASGDELDYLLRAKIVEESRELLESGDTSEIVDILEVIDALLSLRNVDSAFLEIQKHAKRLARGAFEEGYVLSLSSLNDD